MSASAQTGVGASLEGGGVPAIEVRNLSVRYPGEPLILADLSLAIHGGEVLGVTGESGCGKSTLLLCLCGLIPGSVEADMRGEVLLFGRPVHAHTRAEMAQTVGIVFQNPDTQLFCDTVEDELAFGLENLCLPRAEMSERIDEALFVSGLERYRATSPNRLSGGQKQLVVFAAVLAMRPRIWLLDEAFSQVDAKEREALLGLVARLAGEGCTMVIVDHEEGNLRAAGSVLRLGRMDGGGGAV